ncbi:hypothetical protein [Streptomyces sulphureus]|uniref:hypothetical protein n=1 Tax=Streptomyces sulphureus TaxID=47758 RepID=UPI0003714492|nr:hypothetical protein [Streptomyces sulphureus]
MLFRPQLPDAPQTPAQITSVTASRPAIHDHSSASACGCQHTAGPAVPAVAPARRSLSNVSTRAITAVIVSGVVVTALLAAVAVTAISVAFAAVVLRSLMNPQRHH